MAKAKQSGNSEIENLDDVDLEHSDHDFLPEDFGKHSWPYNESDAEWYDAFSDIDHRGDKTELLFMLRYSETISKETRHHLADLIERYQFSKPHGRPRTPSYCESEAEYRMMLAVAKVLHLSDPQTPGCISRDEAIALVAREMNVVEDTIRNACDGKRGSSRRRRNHVDP